MNNSTNCSASIARTALAVAAALAMIAGIAACGDDDTKTTTATTAATNVRGTDLDAIKNFALDKSKTLTAETAKLQQLGQQYYDLAKKYDFNYNQMLENDRDEVKRIISESQAAFRKANPAYEEQEGVVAGVPSLAEYDVILDAGADGSDPENAVPFNLKLPNGKTLKQPGNFFFLNEAALWGTNPEFAAKGVDEADLNDNGKVEFGEALPDANFLLASSRDMHKYALELQQAEEKWQPNDSDAFSALVVMTPTMSEYFESWKNSRFVAGDKSKEQGFVATSRTSDIADILSGLTLIYENVAGQVKKEDPAQAKQISEELAGLHKFAEKIRDQEAAGKAFTAKDADTLGSEAQGRAERIAGQISQAAAKLNIEIQD